MRRSPRNNLPALALAALLAAGCARPTRKPLGRADAGPAVVVVDRKVEPTTVGPSSPEVEPNDLPRQAQPLDDGGRIAGTLALGPKADVDLYRLRGPAPADLGAPTDAGAPRRLAFVVVTPADGAVVLDLVDDKGRAVLSRSAAVGQRVTLSYLLLEGDRVFRVRRPSRGPAPTTELAYTIEASSRLAGPEEEPQPEVEPDDQPAQAVPLPPRGTLTGKLDGPDDRDLIALPALPGGATYRVELAAIAELALEVRLRAGTETLATARGGKGGELRLRDLPGSAAAPLVLQLRAIDGASDTPYTLRVASEPALDSGVEREPNDDRAHANPATPGESIAGYLWPGDVDFYCAPEGTAQLGARVDALPDVTWRMELTDAAGKPVQKVDGKRGGGAELPPTPGARCVRLGGRARDTAFDAPYRLTFVP